MVTFLACFTHWIWGSRLPPLLPPPVLEFLVQSDFFCGKALISRAWIRTLQFPENSSLQQERDFITARKRQFSMISSFLLWETTQYFLQKTPLRISVTISSGIGYFITCSTTGPTKRRSFLTIFHLSYSQKSHNGPGNLNHGSPSSLKHVSKCCQDFLMALSYHKLAKKAQLMVISQGPTLFLFKKNPHSVEQSWLVISKEHEEKLGWGLAKREEKWTTPKCQIGTSWIN